MLWVPLQGKETRHVTKRPPNLAQYTGHEVIMGGKRVDLGLWHLSTLSCHNL